MNIVCIGSSITSGYACLMDQWPVILQMRLEARSPGSFRVFNMGVSGDTSADGKNRFQPNVVDKQPDVLVIEYGINDCVIRPWATRARVALPQFRDNLYDFCEAARRLRALPFLVINHPIAITKDLAEERQRNLRVLAERVEPYNEAIRTTGRDLDVPVIDVAAEVTARHIDPAVMVRDGAHLATRGCLHYGEIVFDALTPVLEKRVRD